MYIMLGVFNNKTQYFMTSYTIPKIKLSLSHFIKTYCVKKVFKKHPLKIPLM